MINPDYLLDTIIDHRYRLTRFIGRGSFGWVYEAAEELHGEMIGRVAIKILSPEDEEQIFNILKEIRGLSQLRHEHVIAYMSSGSIKEGVISGSMFLATELGEISLQKQIEGRKMKEETVHQMAICIAKALSFIHQSGAVHRDVKPANIFRVKGGWKLADFGLVRSVKGTITKASGQRGTLAYISPEIIDYGDVGPVSDVYSLGVTILESLTGRVAHEGTTEGEFIKNLLSKEPSIPEELDSWWKEVLNRCLEKDPRKRTHSDSLLDYLGQDIEERDKTIKSAKKKSARITKEESKKEGNYRQKAPSPKDRVSHSSQGVDFYMRFTPASTFPTGTDDSGSSIVDKDFWIAEIPVTYDLWYETRMWAERNGYTFANQGKEGSHGNTGRAPSAYTGSFFVGLFEKSGKKKEPVTEVSWYDSLVWCNALSQYLGYDSVYTCYGAVIKSAKGISHTNVVAEDREGFRLPTSMEWELAARYKGNDSSYGAIEYPAGSGTYWTPGNYGSGATADYNNASATMAACWYDEEHGGNTRMTQDVGQKPSSGNSLGLFDMSGNVWEWCFTQRGSSRVVRGGSWHYSVGNLQVGFVSCVTPEVIFYNRGFRVLRTHYEKDKTQKRIKKKIVRATKEESKKEEDSRQKESPSPKYRVSHSAQGVDFYMCLAPAATFPTGYNDKGEATVVHDFWIAETPVTYELWYEVRMWALDNGYTIHNRGIEGSTIGGGKYPRYKNIGNIPTGAKKEPVTMVSWYDSIFWCNALSDYLGFDPVYTKHGDVIKNATGIDPVDVVAKERNGFRLPTSHEWELAARYKGSDSYKNESVMLKKRVCSHGVIEYPVGNGNYWIPGNYASGATDGHNNVLATKAAAWYRENSGGNTIKTQDVGQKPSWGNGLGLFDMSGNVWEWCFTQCGSNRVVRGGCWYSTANFLQVGDVNCFTPGVIYNYFGFRFVRTHF